MPASTTAAPPPPAPATATAPGSSAASSSSSASSHALSHSTSSSPSSDGTSDSSSSSPLEEVSPASPQTASTAPIAPTNPTTTPNPIPSVATHPHAKPPTSLSTSQPQQPPPPLSSNNTSSTSNGGANAPPKLGKKATFSISSSGTAPWCHNCHTSTTPLWRRNEFGQILCNACGLFLKLHGRSRPISLKTDVIKSRNRTKANHNNSEQAKTGSQPSSPQTGPTANSQGDGTANGDIAPLRQRPGPKPRKKTALSKDPDQTKARKTASSGSRKTASSALPPLLATLEQKGTPPSSSSSSSFGAVPNNLTAIPPPPKKTTPSQVTHASYIPHQHLQQLPSLRSASVLSPLLANPVTVSIGNKPPSTLRGSIHGTPIADSVIASHSLKAITSPLLLATTKFTPNSPSSSSSTATATTTPAALHLKSFSQPETKHIPALALPTALDQLTKAACTSPYLAPIPQHAEPRATPDATPMAAAIAVSPASKSFDELSSPSLMFKTAGRAASSPSFGAMGAAPAAASSIGPMAASPSSSAHHLHSSTHIRSQLFESVSASDANGPVSSVAGPVATPVKAYSSASVSPSSLTKTAPKHRLSTSPDYKTSVPPLLKKSKEQSLETRVAELELVNDLLQARVSELEAAEAAARKSEAATKASETLVRESEMMLRIKLRDVEAQTRAAEARVRRLRSYMLDVIQNREIDAPPELHADIKTPRIKLEADAEDADLLELYRKRRQDFRLANGDETEEEDREDDKHSMSDVSSRSSTASSAHSIGSRPSQRLRKPSSKAASNSPPPQKKIRVGK